MAFRAEEAKSDGLKAALNYFAGPHTNLSEAEREAASALIQKLSRLYIGPAVHTYPTWHPLMTAKKSKLHDYFYPEDGCGYPHLDHTIYFAHGFITCPYSEQCVDELLKSVASFRKNKVYEITAEILDRPIYAKGAIPVLVSCKWKYSALPLPIPSGIAVALMLQNELKAWERIDKSTPWEKKASDLLGSPHGQLSSLFVTRETGLKMRKVWQAINNAHVFDYGRGMEKGWL